MRMFSLFMDQQLDELNKVIPINKMWIWSKIQRPEHARIDGQTRGLNQKFDVPLPKGGSIKMRFPRDPAVQNHPEAIINCGCYEVPVPVGEPVLYEAV